MAERTGRDVAAMLEPVAVRVAVGMAAVLTSLSIAWTFSQERGLAIGVLGGLFYGALMMTLAASPRSMIRWSARHPLGDALMFVPIVFFALLLVRPLPWWGAALAAVGLGVVIVPPVVRRRRRLLLRDGSARS